MHHDDTSPVTTESTEDIPDLYEGIARPVNTRHVSDSIDVFRTAGNRIGITISVYGNGWQTTFLTPREWYEFVASGNAVAAAVTNHEVANGGQP